MQNRLSAMSFVRSFVSLTLLGACTVGGHLETDFVSDEWRTLPPFDSKDAAALPDECADSVATLIEHLDADTFAPRQRATRCLLRQLDRDIAERLHPYSVREGKAVSAEQRYRAREILQIAEGRLVEYEAAESEIESEHVDDCPRYEYAAFRVLACESPFESDEERIAHLFPARMPAYAARQRKGYVALHKQAPDGTYTNLEIKRTPRDEFCNRYTGPQVSEGIKNLSCTFACPCVTLADARLELWEVEAKRAWDYTPWKTSEHNFAESQFAQVCAHVCAKEQSQLDYNAALGERPPAPWTSPQEVQIVPIKCTYEKAYRAGKRRGDEVATRVRYRPAAL